MATIAKNFSETESNEEMQRGLKNRHLQMIALGGAIGAGLFYGSASTIALAGPAVMLSYLVGGLVIFFIMRMLGEMAVDSPVSGSFSYYATRYWGKFPGFLAGWNYWFEYIIVSMAELTVVGIYINFWFPDIPQWISALVCLVIITVINLFNVSAYGEVEFWMSFIKVSAIIAMIFLGLILIFEQPFPQNFSNIWLNGGFFPNGVTGFILSLAPVMFSFGGIELIGITAGEAKNPEKTIPTAINQVIWRILIFYVGTMIVLMALSPWNRVGAEASPFVQIFSDIGITTAANILNFVVLIAAISVYNSAIYSNSRMLYGLSSDGNAPRFLGKLSTRGVPVYGILFSSSIALIVVAVNFFFPSQAFTYMLSITTAAAVISWAVIVITHIKFREYCKSQNKDTAFKSIAYPLANYFCIAFLAGILIIMLTMEDMRLAVFILPVWILFIRFCYQYSKK